MYVVLLYTHRLYTYTSGIWRYYNHIPAQVDDHKGRCAGRYSRIHEARRQPKVVSLSLPRHWQFRANGKFENSAADTPHRSTFVFVVFFVVFTLVVTGWFPASGAWWRRRHHDYHFQNITWRLLILFFDFFFSLSPSVDSPPFFLLLLPVWINMWSSSYTDSSPCSSSTTTTTRRKNQKGENALALRRNLTNKSSRAWPPTN